VVPLTGVEAGLLLVVIHDGRVKSHPLRLLHLVFEAAVAPGDQHESFPASVAAVSAVLDGHARLDRVRSAQRAADPIAADAGPCDAKRS
jgi:hypothetical protein